MPKVQIQLPFGTTLPTQGELGWNAGPPVIKPDNVEQTMKHQNHTEPEKQDWDPDNPDGTSTRSHGWQLGD